MADAVISLAAIIALAGVALSLVRFIAGPTLLNRVVAFDAMSIVVISLIALLAHILDRFIYIDVAVVYGLLSFLGVLVVARYHERGL